MLFSGPATADRETGHVRVETGDCRWLVRHRPADGVAFEPGVDRRGRPVTPADLEGAPRLRLPPELKLRLEIPLALLGDRNGLPRLAEAELQLGEIRIDRQSGEVSHNGEPLTPAATRHLVAACRDALKR
ncbi:MAG: hypothetical protein QF893_12085 [Alphaproteobacteria bacterium]|jgi:hypothetical protein|nr:hypothetical protein [Alphaproteobacteria bacterium]